MSKPSPGHVERATTTDAERLENEHARDAIPARGPAGPRPPLPPPEQLAEVLTVPEVAELLRVDRKTIYGLIERDQLPGVLRVGRLIRISRSALLQWMRDAGHPHNDTE